MVVLLRTQLRTCVERSYEQLVLGNLIDIVEATPTLTREQAKAAYQHLQETPGLPSIVDDTGVFVALQDWLYGCPNAVLKALAPEDASELDRIIPAESLLRLVDLLRRC